MSLFLFHGPRDRRAPRKDLDDDYTGRCLRKAKAAKAWIHPKLGFEEMMKNKPLPVSDSLMHSGSRTLLTRPS